MKKLMIQVLLAAFLLSGCGEGEAEQANPLSLVPEDAMMSFVLNDPASIIRNIDGYIEDGAPILGAAMLENLICEQLDIASLDSMAARYGFDPSGQIVFFMESAMPQSMVIAASAPDLPLFLSLMEEMGAEFADEEPMNGQPVYSIDTENGNMFITGSAGVAVMTLSAGKLETVVSELSGDAALTVDPASLYMKFNMAMIGPMAAGQMPMARMIMMQGFAEDPDMPSFVPAMMDIYMDGIEIFLTQADLVEITLTVGPEDFAVRKNITFLEGSDLAAMFAAPSSGRDMLELVPAGNVATVRFRMDEELLYSVTSALTEAFTESMPEETIQFWSSISSNSAISVYDDQAMHLVAAYELSEDITIEQIALMYNEYLNALTPILSESPEMAEAFSCIDNGVVQIDGTDFYSMSMSISVDSTSSMLFEYWLTVHDGALLLETGTAPEKLLSVISGEYEPAEVTGTGDNAGEMSLAGYLTLVMAFSPAGMEVPEIGSDVIIRWDGGADNGAIRGEMIMNGRDAVATGFAFAGILSAAM